MMQVKIDNRFYENAKNDYSDWVFAWIREAGQNSLDAGATLIEVEVTRLESDKIRVVWRDNGCGMSKDTLLNKFLTIGASGKEFRGTVGGWGVAKIILVLCHSDWCVRTRHHVVRGQWGQFEIDHTDWPLDGTELDVTMSGVTTNTFIEQAKQWIESTTTSCKFLVNGEPVQPCPPIGDQPVRQLDWADIYVHGNHNGLIHVRINGQLMFHKWTSANASIVLELKDRTALTTNRDGLAYNCSIQVDKMLSVLTADPSQILESDAEQVVVIQGTLGQILPDRGGGAQTPDAVRLTAEEIAEIGKKVAYRSTVPADTLIPPSELHIDEADTTPIDGHDLVILNKLTTDVPKWLLPPLDEYAKRLINRWNAIVKTAAQILGITSPIRTGWTLRLDHVAAYFYSAETGHCILINPIHVTDNKVVPRWQFGWNDFNAMVAAAVHELTHMTGSKWHSDCWAAHFTDNIAKICARSKEINSLYSTT